MSKAANIQRVVTVKPALSAGTKGNPMGFARTRAATSTPRPSLAMRPRTRSDGFMEVALSMFPRTPVITPPAFKTVTKIDNAV